MRAPQGSRCSGILHKSTGPCSHLAAELVNWGLNPLKGDSSDCSVRGLDRDTAWPGQPETLESGGSASFQFPEQPSGVVCMTLGKSLDIFQVPIPAPSEVARGHPTGCEGSRVPSGGAPGITQPEGKRAAGTPVLPRTVQVRQAAAERVGVRCLHRWQRRPRRRRHAKAARRLGTPGLLGAVAQPRRPLGRVHAGPRGRPWNGSTAPPGAAPSGAPSRRPARAPASSRSPRAPLPAASQLRAPGAGKKPHAPARNAGPGGRGAGAGQGRAGRAGSSPPGRLARVGEPARACPGRSAHRPETGWPRGRGRRGPARAALPFPTARPWPRQLGGGGRPSHFPTPLPVAAAGFGAPVGSRGLISRRAGVWPAGPRVVSHTRRSPSPGAQRGPSPSCVPPWPRRVSPGLA